MNLSTLDELYGWSWYIMVKRNLLNILIGSILIAVMAKQLIYMGSNRVIYSYENSESAVPNQKEEISSVDISTENEVVIYQHEPATMEKEVSKIDESSNSGLFTKNKLTTDYYEYETISGDENEEKQPLLMLLDRKNMDRPPYKTALDDVLILVNKDFDLPSDYKPDDLVVPNVRFSFQGNHEKQNMRRVAASALEELFTAAEKEDIILYAVSGFRSYKSQQSIYNSNKNKYGENNAAVFSARPGHSEHQTGLAMDVSSKSVGYLLTQRFGNTKEGIWLAENAHKYGFIIRYQRNKEHITGYIYEPWHIRYVGMDAAKEIFENDLALEEYLLN